MKILITGAAGFIGAHLVEHIVRNTDWNIYCIDKLTYSSKGWSRLNENGYLTHPQIKTFTWDLVVPLSEGLIKELGDIDIIVHMAAETHVDISIRDPVGVISNNVMSTVHMLEYARKLPKLQKFQYFSTDEVYGPAAAGVNFKEWDPHRPTNPYSASKAAAEDICLAYANTYKTPVIITNLMNCYGERQYIEKFLPLVVKKVLNDETVEIHTHRDGINPGSRNYIHARNVSAAVLFILEKGEVGEKYNITGEREIDNLEMAQIIADTIGKPLKYQLVEFHSNRPGHDPRYSLDGSKLFTLGWEIPVSLENSIQKTVKWTLKHPQWLEE